MSSSGMTGDETVGTEILVSYEEQGHAQRLPSRGSSQPSVAFCATWWSPGALHVNPAREMDIERLKAKSG